MAAEERATAREAPGSGVRALAAKINARVVAGGSSLEAAFAAYPPPPDRDLGLLRELCYGSLRWHHRLAHQAKRLLRRPWDPVDPPLASLMRIGLYQLQWMRVPDHAAVAATVSAAEALGKIRAKGFVNAVLRRFLREREKLTASLSSVREAVTSHPDWMVGSTQGGLAGRLAACDRREQWATAHVAAGQLAPHDPRRLSRHAACRGHCRRARAEPVQRRVVGAATAQGFPARVRRRPGIGARCRRAVGGAMAGAGTRPESA